MVNVRSTSEPADLLDNDKNRLAYSPFPDPKAGKYVSGMWKLCSRSNQLNPLTLLQFSNFKLFALDRRRGAAERRVHDPRSRAHRAQTRPVPVPERSPPRDARPFARRRLVLDRPCGLLSRSRLKPAPGSAFGFITLREVSSGCRDARLCPPCALANQRLRPFVSLAPSSPTASQSSARDGLPPTRLRPEILA